MRTTQPTHAPAALLTLSLLVAGCSDAGTTPEATTGDDPAATSGRDAVATTPAPVAAATLRLAHTGGLADAHVEALQDEVTARADTGLTLAMASPVDSRPDA